MNDLWIHTDDNNEVCKEIGRRAAAGDVFAMDLQRVFMDLIIDKNTRHCDEASAKFFGILRKTPTWGELFRVMLAGTQR